MKVKLKLKPGDRGTKKLVSYYGDKLVCVRYRYDTASRKRYKTVELIVEEVPWKSKPKPGSGAFVRIGWHEKDLKDKIKIAGGQYYSNRRLWKVDLDKVKMLGIGERVVKFEEKTG